MTVSGRSQRHRSWTTRSPTTRPGASRSCCPTPTRGPPCTGGTLNRRCSARAAACTTTGAMRCSTTSSGTTAATGTRPTATSISSTSRRSRPTASRGNTDPQRRSPRDAAALQTDVPALQRRRRVPANINIPLPRMRCCATRRSSLPPFGCQPGDHYPRRTKIVMHPLPPAAKLPTMPNPCEGVPPNPWCPAQARRTTTGASAPRRRGAGDWRRRARAGERRNLSGR